MGRVRVWWFAGALLTILFCLANFAASDPDANAAAAKKVRGQGLLSVRNQRRPQKNKFPLKAEDARRKSKRAGECRLAKNVYEIGDTWSPDLGEPFGTMFCIQCTCEAVQKKRRVVGRVKCRNVKNDCPVLECSDAVSLPGQCCKVCPDSLKLTDNHDMDGASDDNDGNENNKEYAALLTPRSSTLIKSSIGLGEPLSSGVGSGRFLFLHKSLYYSFVHNDVLVRPKYVQFVDGEGNVVEEQEVSMNNYQHDTKKICGVWQKMPRVYRKLLKEEKLYAALVTEKINGDNDRFIAGRIAKQRYMATELYSSLLEPSSQVGTGGMAVVSVSAATGSIYLNVVFNGDFKEDRNISINVRVSDGTGAGIEEAVRIPKIQYETNSIEVRGILEAGQLGALTRGTLFVVVYSPKNPDFKLIGFIQARTTCDIFDTVLSSESTAVKGGGSGGIAWVYPLPDGSWSYNLQLPEEHTPISIKMETGRKVLEELPIALSNNMTREVVTGMSSRYYQLLYEGNIFLNVVTDKASLRGRLVYRGFGDSQLSDAPLVLQPGNRTERDANRAQGLVWIGIDEDCGMNYQLTLSERPQSGLMRLEVMEMPGLHRIGVPVRSYVLADFEASEYEGVFQDIPKMSYAHLKAGDALFKVIWLNDSSELATAVIRNVRVPANCLPTAPSDNTVNPDYTLEPEDEFVSPLPNNKCFYDGKLSEEGSQWTPANDTCRICTCYKGQVKCEAVVCPAVDCVNPVFLTGECCRSCLTPKASKVRPQTQQGCHVEGDRFHSAGSSWHPYMPPNGFMVCTTCTCNSETLTVKCTKEECPTLKCAPEEAIYPRPLACCKVCPPTKKTSEDEAMDERDFPKAPSEAEVLALGGCKFRGELHSNNEEWNHRIEPFGYMPCVTCTCRNGETKCAKKKCPTLNCEVKVQVEGGCCQKCADSPQNYGVGGGSGGFLAGDASSSLKSGYSSATRTKKPPKHRAKNGSHSPSV